MAKIKGLYLVLNHVPEKLHRVGNRLGDNVSRKVALSVLDDVSVDFDRPAKKVKTDVELLYQGNLNPRKRHALASKLDIADSAFFADNVGKVTIFPKSQN